ncbi:hypothetical protein Tco_1145503 [Tanacetum coccineum]
MTTLVEFMIIAGADNRPPMLEKSLYDAWKTRMEFYMENRENRRMILDSVQNGPLIRPTIVQEDGTTRKKTYTELCATKKLQADCACKPTNIFLQGLPPDVYAIINHHKVAKEIWDRVKLLMQGTKLSLQENECKLYDKFDKFSFVKGHMAKQCTQPKQPRNAAWFKEKAMLAEAHEDGQILDEEQLAILADPCIPHGQAAQTIIPNIVVLMANLSNYGSKVISEEKMIDSQMDDMIREKLALKEQVDSLEENLSKQIKEKECLLRTFTVFKNESKEREDKYMENKIDLEKKIKKLDNILFKVGQSAQTVHMLTKPQAFYDNIYNQALGYQNPFHLMKAQRIKATLYDGIVMSDKHVAIPVIDDEETLILEKKSR